MKTPSPPGASSTSKLLIRSEVLAVVRHLASLAEPSRQEAAKQLKRLQALDNPTHVQDILMKELQRNPTSETLHVLIQLLMELGDLETLQDRLWGLIRDPQTADEVKDAANLVLRHLGDNTDPDLYLEYLQDPEGLIGRETIRMLEISSENPEALIDFIDFILSLAEGDQVKLLSSLEKDYPAHYLVNLYLPLLESDPAPVLWEKLVALLAESKSPVAAEVLSRLAGWPQERLPVPVKMLQKAVKQLRLAGARHLQGTVSLTPPATDPEETLPPLIRNTVPYHCYATISDGIGNQGLVFSRERANGDISMMSVAINDVHGIIDCFGFYQLSVADFQRICEKFHETTSKIQVPPGYCADKLQRAEAINVAQASRLPYEYRCWQPLLADIPPDRPEVLDTVPDDWVREAWYGETGNLYQHPDLNTWFLEQGDLPEATTWLQQMAPIVEAYCETASPDLQTTMDRLNTLVTEMMSALLATPWRMQLAARLAETAYLLDCQGTHTFRNLAATEAHKLSADQPVSVLLAGFVTVYGQRCVVEELLRLKMGNPRFEPLPSLVEAVLQTWQIP